MASGFSMRALTGGMTNAVFRCSKPGGENQTVLLRSYGKGTEVGGVGGGWPGRLVGMGDTIHVLFPSIVREGVSIRYAGFVACSFSHSCVFGV